MVLNAKSERASDLLARLLDKGYEDEARRVLGAIDARAKSLNKSSFKALQDEAERLAAEGGKLSPDNPVYRAFAADLSAMVDDAKKAIGKEGAAIQNAAVNAADEVARQLPLPFVDPQFYDQAARVLAGWQVVSADAVAAIVDYVGKPEWIDALNAYGESVIEPITNTVLRGFIYGYNPLRVAREIARMSEQLPQAYANSLLRTLYLHSYRKATTASYQANRNIGEYAVRVGTLDNRICLACILLHGTRLELDEVVQDHWNGRCTSVLKLKGIPLNVPTGRDWFLQREAGSQREIMGESAWNAWRAGQVQLDQFVSKHSDPLFGEMPTVASLKSLLSGDGN